MLHSGHIAFFKEAATYGDLYVALGSDRTVYDLKGRLPVNSEQERLFLIQSVAYVKDVFISRGSGMLDFELELREMHPDIFIVNEDGNIPEKRALCRELGIIVVPVGDRWRGLPSPLLLALTLGVGPRWMNSAAADRWHRAWARAYSGSGQANRKLVAHILETVRRDPGRRVLVTIRMERRYAVIDGLCQADEVALVPVEASPG